MKTDFLVIGAGMVGINVARELKQRFTDATVAVIDKENGCGRHSSGRNVGMLDAGFSWPVDSLKARFCKEGNQQLSQYCEDRKLSVNRCGELVIARDDDELSALDEIQRRADSNGVKLESLTVEQAKEVEPRARVHEQALFSPASAAVDPLAVLRQMEQDARDAGVKFYYGNSYLRKAGDELIATLGTIQAGYVVNCAGLYADQIAQEFGFAGRYRMLPIKHNYLESSEAPGAFRTHITAAGELSGNYPGVRIVLGVDGRPRLGPAVKPALWREQYHGAEGFQPFEMSGVVTLGLAQMFQGGKEICKACLQRFTGKAHTRLVTAGSRLAEGVSLGDYRDWARPEIQPQLVDTETHSLVADFVVEGDDKSMHVLNTVSPTFTSGLPFARYVCEQIATATGS